MSLEHQAIDIVESKSIKERIHYLVDNQRKMESYPFEASIYTDLDTLVYFHCLIDLLDEAPTTISLLYTADSVGVLLRIVNDILKRDRKEYLHGQAQLAVKNYKARQILEYTHQVQPEVVLHQ
jgi:hypothetical protein